MADASRKPHSKEGLLTGAVLGLIESLLVAGTGFVPRADLVLVWCFDVLLGGAVGSGIDRMARLVRPWTASALVLATPFLLLSLRGRISVPSRPETIAALLGVGAATAVIFLVVRVAARRNDGALSQRFVLVVASFSSLVALGLNEAARSLMPLLERERVAEVVSGFLAGVAWMWASLSHDPVERSTWARVLRTGSVAGALATGIGQLFVVGRPPALIANGIVSAGTTPSDASNVVLITLDTVRRDHLSCYGYAGATSPHLAGLARRATLYTRAYATSPYTLSSHASLFTGLLPSAHGAHPVPFDRARRDTTALDDIPLPSRRSTLAEFFASRGYRTGAQVANPVQLTPRSGLSRGFHTYDSSPRRQYGHLPLLESFLYRLGPVLPSRWFLAWTKNSREADEISDRAIAWIKEDGTRPFFLFLNYFDAHAPYAPPEEFAAANRSPFAQLRFNRRFALREQDWAFLTGQYDGSIRFVDREVGRVLAFLETSPLTRNTLIIVTSDHGEFLGEHGLRSHGQELLEPVLQIPLLVRRPGQTAAERNDTLMTLADVYWLIRDFVENGSPSAAGQATPRVVAEYWTPLVIHLADPSRFSSPAMRAVYDRNLKLIERSLGSPQLFDLSQDPGEEHNIALSEDWASDVRRLSNAVPSLSSGEPTQAPIADPETLRRLRGLGYIR